MTHIQLAGGARVPAIGLGFWKIEKDRTAEVVREAVGAGYRHFDCACDYGNEAQAGQGLASVLRDGAVSRDDLWITSKLWNTYHHPDHVAAACEKTLLDLQLDHLDLYHIHFPIAQRYVPMEHRYPPEWFFDPTADSPRVETEAIPMSDTWAAMQRLVERGLVRHTGLCNVGTAMIRELTQTTGVAPAMLQIELHPELSQQKLVRFCHQSGIGVTAFSPLGAPSYIPIGMAGENDSLLEHPTLVAIGRRVGRSVAQVILRWGVQRGTAVIPKTSRVDRLAENAALFDFELTAEDMAAIDQFDRHRRYNDPGDFCESAFNTYFPIFD